MGTKQILIVDDAVDMRIFISTLFETSGYIPIAVRDGKVGIEKAIEIKPDLIILDVMMPGEGGANMYRELKVDRSLKDIPVIMLSAIKKTSFYHYLKMLNIQLDSVVPNPDAYMEKPPEANDLLNLAKKLLGDI